jgi:hypothetical protein
MRTAVIGTGTVGRTLGVSWRDVLDLGDLTAARAMEMYLPLWLRIFRAVGTGILNIKVVRGGRRVVNRGRRATV